MDDLLLDRGRVIPGSELTERFSRSSGPGGQHANKTSSRVELSLDLTTSGGLSELMKRRAIDRLGKQVLTVVAEDSRSQFRNRQLARRRLAERLNELLKPPPPERRKTKPSRRAKQRRLDAKKRVGEKKKTRGRAHWE